MLYIGIAIPIKVAFGSAIVGMAVCAVAGGLVVWILHKDGEVDGKERST